EKRCYFKYLTKRLQDGGPATPRSAAPGRCARATVRTTIGRCVAAQFHPADSFARLISSSQKWTPRGPHAEQQNARRSGGANRQGDREFARERHREEREGDASVEPVAPRRRTAGRVRHAGAGAAQDAREAGSARSARR